jgi:Fic family protein
MTALEIAVIMPVTMFKPKFRFSGKIIAGLMKIEAVKGRFELLPVTPRLLAALRHSARLRSTHYSTMIEGNRLSEAEVAQVVAGGGAVKGNQRDEAEVLGYYVALDELERMAERTSALSEDTIKKLHALVMGSGRKRVTPTPYRTAQNVITQTATGRIIYLPPTAHDVPVLMASLIQWLADAEKKEIPCPVRAAVAHYQFATIHPYIDGNGRTARLLATLVLRLGGYGLKGVYSLDEYYAKDLQGYYNAITVGPSHNYYIGRAKADITRWVEYFIQGMAMSFEAVKGHAEAEPKAGNPDRSGLLRQLDARQKKTLDLFLSSDCVTAKEIGALLGVKDRMARNLCKGYVEKGFFAVTDPARKSRKYTLGKKWKVLLER